MEEYQIKWPDAFTYTTLAKKLRARTPAQRKKQSKTLKARFKTPAGEVTRKQIQERSLRLHHEEGYREKAAAHLRGLNADPIRQQQISEQMLEMWSEGGAVREATAKWRAKNQEQVQQNAMNARSYIKRKRSKLHLGFKALMVQAGLEGFVTEHEVRWYSIDEARPDLKLAVEVDGCYWHSCPTCGLEGPSSIAAYDARKTSYLLNRGWTIVRLWGHDIRQRPDWCLDQVRQAVQQIAEAA